MHGRAHREAGCLYKTEEGRNTPPERKGMGILSNEEECSKSEAKQKYPPGEECRPPEWGSTVKG